MFFRVHNRSGALNQVLSVLNAERVNVEHIHPYTDPTMDDDICFFAECAGHEEDEGFARALAALVGCTEAVHTLGSFVPAHAAPSLD